MVKSPRMGIGNGVFYPIVGFATCMAFIYKSFGDLLVNYSKEPELSFVQRNGTHFTLDGRIFCINGWNSYYLMDHAVDEYTRPKVTAMLQARSKIGLTVCRTWAFNDGRYNSLQISPGQYDDHIFKGAITKRMTAIEEMAGMDVLCSDKTRTLTLNKLTVDKSLIGVFARGVDADTVVLMAMRASRVENKDAIDTAIVGTLADPKEVLKDLALPPPPEPKKDSAKAKATSATSSKRKGFEEEEDEEVEQKPATKKAKKPSTPVSKATTGKDQPSKASNTAIADHTRASASKSPPEGSPPTVVISSFLALEKPNFSVLRQNLDEGGSSDSSGGLEPNSPAFGEVKTTSFSLGTPKTQPSAEKKPILLDLDDESFDKFFQTVEELVKPTALGASGSGIGSSTPSSFAPEEVIQVKEVLKAALGLGIDSVFH
ncbi:hypothetical protein RHGRI_033927 [Rhododendron griersonianum]|uniref:Uncharacterized protein n=1 Tax=Rhododendron griersonianum TaxID=479676 RepID=A0AAV6I1N5_9ERIC|nr:hypothetical protein RHGRI_033927 [Rhododendron griersonianum]